MNIWLCPVKPKNWRGIKNRKIFGVPKRASKLVEEVKPDDLLVFHVLKPINGIIAIGKVVSEVFEDNQDIWGKYRYPLRFRIELITTLGKKKGDPIPLSLVFGSQTREDITVEPYLKDIWLVKLTEGQFQNIKTNIESLFNI